MRTLPGHEIQQTYFTTLTNLMSRSHEQHDRYLSPQEKATRKRNNDSEMDEVKAKFEGIKIVE